MKSKPIYIGIIVLVVAIVAYGAWRWRPANNDNFPQGTYWICKNGKCGNQFVLTMKQLSDHHAKHYGQPVTCPKCGQEATRAERCAKCGKFYPMTREVTPCPACGAKPA